MDKKFYEKKRILMLWTLWAWYKKICRFLNLHAVRSRVSNLSLSNEMMENRFGNKCVVVTGAASGIGREVVLRIVSEGGNVALIDSDKKGLDETVAMVSNHKVKIKSFVCNVANEVEVEHAVQAIVDSMGSVQALSHNAGILKTYTTHMMKLDEFNEIIQVNLIGTFLINRAFIPHLLKNDRSYIVNMSSSAVQRPHPWCSAYAASKGAISAFTKSIFIEYYRQGLRANCICPGGVNTNMLQNFQVPKNVEVDLIKYITPFLKFSKFPSFADPKHIAGVIAMLCSDDAWYMNGSDIIVNNGGV